MSSETEDEHSNEEHKIQLSLSSQYSVLPRQVFNQSLRQDALDSRLQFRTLVLSHPISFCCVDNCRRSDGVALFDLALQPIEIISRLRCTASAPLLAAAPIFVAATRGISTNCRRPATTLRIRPSSAALHACFVTIPVAHVVAAAIT
jgi:hypothetical protein